MTNPKSARSWRVIDIIIASVLGVACGLIFYMWNIVGYAWYTVADAATPGLGGIATGIWLLGGTLGGLIIRKPGAAIYVEMLAAAVSAGIGNQWGIETLYSGLAQGIGAEIVFSIFLYKRYSLGVAALAGAGAAATEWVLELFTSANYAKSGTFLITYFSTMVVSGVILAGVLAWILMKALAATGALDRFAAGREVRGRV